MKSEPATLTGLLATRALQVAGDGVPEFALHAAKRALLNVLAAAAAGSRDREVEALVSWLSSAASAAGSATVCWRPEKVSPADAAHVNGAMMHVREYDDTHLQTRLHAAAPIAGALLPLAEARGAGGRTVLVGLVVGIESAIAMADGINPDHYDLGFHVTATAGAIGAAVACGIAAGLSPGRLQNAIGLAAGSSVGYTAMFGSSGKSYCVGSAARAGLAAAELAARGMDAAPSILEAQNGVLAATAVNRGDATLAGVIERTKSKLDEVGSRWRTADLAMKAYQTGQGMHGPLDAALRLRARESTVAGGRLGRVVIHVPPFVAGVAGGEAHPTSTLQARFDLRYCVAVALLDGGFSATELAEERVLRADVVRLRGQVTMQPNPAVSLGQAVLEVEADGSWFRETVEACSGSPANPLTDEQLREKLVAEIGPRLGTQDTARVLEAIESLEGESNLRTLLAYLSSGQP